MVAVIAPFSQKRRTAIQQLSDMIPDVDKVLHEIQNFSDNHPQQNIAIENACRWLLEVSIQFDLGGL